MTTKIIVSNHAIRRYNLRFSKLPNKKIKNILKRIIKKNGINPHVDSATMYSICSESDMALILTTNEDGNIIIKTVLTINQFNDQMREIAIGSPNRCACDVSMVMKLGHDDGDVNTDILVKIGDSDV